MMDPDRGFLLEEFERAQTSIVALGEQARGLYGVAADDADEHIRAALVELRAAWRAIEEALRDDQ